jgi:HIRAN domain
LAVQKASKEMKFRVVGMKYRLSRSTRLILEKRLPLLCRLVREPENEADPNAVAVYVRSEPWRGTKLGYLPRGVAKEIAPRLDAKRLKVIRVTLVSLDVAEDEGQLIVKARG